MTPSSLFFFSCVKVFGIQITREGHENGKWAAKFKYHSLDFLRNTQQDEASHPRISRAFVESITVFTPTVFIEATRHWFTHLIIMYIMCIVVCLSLSLQQRKRLEVNDSRRENSLKSDSLYFWYVDITLSLSLHNDIFKEDTPHPNEKKGRVRVLISWKVSWLLFSSSQLLNREENWKRVTDCKTFKDMNGGVLTWVSLSYYAVVVHFLAICSFVVNHYSSSSLFCA